MASFENDPQSAKFKPKIKKVQIMSNIPQRSEKKMISSKQDHRTSNIAHNT